MTCLTLATIITGEHNSSTLNFYIDVASKICGGIIHKYRVGGATSFEQEMEKRADWAPQACAANQPISPFPAQSLLHHPVGISSQFTQHNRHTLTLEYYCHGPKRFVHTIWTWDWNWEFGTSPRQWPRHRPRSTIQGGPSGRKPGFGWLGFGSSTILPNCRAASAKLPSAKAELGRLE